MRTHRDKVRRKSIAHKTNEIQGKTRKGNIMVVMKMKDWNDILILSPVLPI